ncbi:DEKNAAC105172 [Brettanomyces naardenensis]|uniref:DEKNAAC105172 n=1 Tax=Brettanomyces naardenensis TaxID=13370 RepID=A0A448YSU6_BRENA|nr:DEKNAAC105172 [Brettanomyces naardenensis]
MRTLLLDQSKDQPLILSIGSRTIQFGISGQAKPLITLQTSSYSRPQLFSVQELSLHSLNEKDRLDNPPSLPLSLPEDLQSLKFLFYPDLLVCKDSAELVKTYQYNLQGHLFLILEDLFRRINFNAMNAKVFVLDDDYHNEWYKRILADTLLNKLQARSMVLLPKSLMCVLGAGISNGLVIDCGWNMVTVEPVYDYRVLGNYSGFTRRGGMRLHYRVVEEIMSEGKEGTTEEYDFDMVETMIRRYTEGKATEDQNEATSHLPNLVNSCFFSDGQYDIDDKPPALLAFQIVKGLPIDIRREISSHIVIVGGLSNIPGFCKTLLDQITQLLADGGLEFTAKQVYSVGAWSGASLFSSSMLPKHGVGRVRELRRD